MSRRQELHRFYASDTWQDLRAALIAERGNRCEYCGKDVANARELTLHHIKELTPDNVHDAMIALNPENIQVVHHGCHNKIHRRGAKDYIERNVYLVYGPPLAGKSSYVRDRMQPGDIVVDMDMLYMAVSGLKKYSKPDELLPTVLGLQAALIDNIKTRYGKWHNAWIIGGYADRYKRDKLARDTGAGLVFLYASADECKARLEQVTDIRKEHKKAWAGYIDKWFETYTE